MFKFSVAIPSAIFFGCTCILNLPLAVIFFLITVCLLLFVSALTDRLYGHIPL